MLRITHRVCGPALAAALLLIGMSTMGITDAAAQGSPEARQACTPDAMRLCGMYLLDPRSVEACLRAAGPRLSQPCYDVFFPPQAAPPPPPPMRGAPPPKGSRKRPPPPPPQEDED